MEPAITHKSEKVCHGRSHCNHFSPSKPSAARKDTEVCKVKRHNVSATGDSTALEQLVTVMAQSALVFLRGITISCPSSNQNTPVRVLNDPGLPLLPRKRLSQHSGVSPLRSFMDDVVLRIESLGQRGLLLSGKKLFWAHLRRLTGHMTRQPIAVKKEG